MKEKILIVEDDAIAKLTLITFLQNFGYSKPFTADNALDAYDIVKNNHIDLILMDIFINGNKDGIELAHEVNKIADIPIIYTTASTDPKTFDRAKKTEPYAFITKPYDDKLLKNTIIMALNKHKNVRYHKIERSFDVKSFSEEVIDHLEVGVAVINSMGYIVAANKKAEEIMGYSKEELINFHATKFYAPEFKAEGEKILKHFFSPENESTLLELEVPLTHKNGNTIKADIKSTLMESEDGKSYKVSCFEDCTERINLEQTVKEKENLIKEVHHRVKNNLQVVSGLLYLQAEKIKNDKNIYELFQESINRINTMSMIHEKLYRAQDLQSINMKDYIAHLTQNILKTYSKHNILLKMELQDLKLGIDQAILCGLIINEIVSNSCKHAFTSSGGQIAIEMSNGDEFLKLSISDNGIGMDLDRYRNSTSLGSQLISNLTKQLDAEVDINVENGTSYFIKIRIH